MQKLILAVIIGIILGCSNSKQNSENSKVPELVKSAFSAKYPQSSALTWEYEGGSYEAEFSFKKKAFTAVFDANGKFIEEETEINVSDLAKSIKDYCKTNYSDFKISEATIITNNLGEEKFEAELSKGKTHFDVYFDKNGKFITKESTKLNEGEN